MNLPVMRCTQSIIKAILTFWLQLAFYTITASIPANNLVFYKIGIYDGLPGSTIFSIHQDKFGFMWFGTREGLVRFDGQYIKTLNYLSDRDFNLTGKMITSIAEDKHGNLFLGIWENGLVYYNRQNGTLKRVVFNSSANAIILNPNVWDLAIAADGLLYIGTLGQGLFFADPELFVAKPFHSPDSSILSTTSFISAIYSEDSTVWISVRDKGLVKIETNSQNPGSAIALNSFNDVSSLNVNCIFRDSNSRLWFGSTGLGPFYFDENLNSPVKYSGNFNSLSEITIRSITEDLSKNLYMGTDGNGLFTLNLRDEQLSNFTFSPSIKESISSNTIFTLHTCASGSIWIGTNKGGVNVIHPQPGRLTIVSDSRFPTILSGFQIMSVLEDKSGCMWFGTDGSGIISSASGITKHNNFYESETWFSKPGLAIKTIFEDSQGTLYFGSYGHGMGVLNAERNYFINFQHHNTELSLSQDDVWDFAEDKYGKIWIATLNGGLNLFDPDNQTFIAIKGLSNSDKNQIQNILALQYDTSNSRLWIATVKGLFFLEIQPDNVILKRAVEELSHPLSFAEVKTIYLDHDNYLWAGTRSYGAFRLEFSTGAIFSIGQKQGLKSNTIASITGDNNENIWIATSKGLSRYNKHTQRLFNYLIDDGLNVREYLTESYALLKDGKLVFGGVHGVDIIDPARIGENHQVPSVFFTRLTISNQEIIPDGSNKILQTDITFQKSIKLKYSQNTFSLEFIAPDYTFPERISYACFLDGFDKHMNYIGNQGKVAYTNMDPGTYRLKVFAANEDGLWDENGTWLDIIIVPPWWQTTYARLSLLLFIIGGSVIFYILKNRSHIRRQQHLEIMVAKRTGELEQEKKIVELQNYQLEKVKEELMMQNGEILKQKLEIDSVCKKLQEADRLKIEFFTNISHEIRTPLTLMANPLNDLIKLYGGSDNTLLSHLKLIQLNQKQLLELMNQWLEFQKLEHEPAQLRAFPQDLVFFVEEVLLQFQDIAQSKNIAIKFLPQMDIPEVWFDADKMRMVLLNLLSNALKFTPKGGEIMINISKQTVNIDKPILHAVISLHDTGIGIGLDEIEMIFDRFYQTEQGRKTAQAGTGIGLTIVKKMITLHHGKVLVSSEPNKGSKFDVFLPIGSNHLKEEEKRLRPPDSGDGQIASKILPENLQRHSKALKDKKRRYASQKVLVVEDNNELRNYLLRCFSSQFDVRAAADGLDGLKKAVSFIPDIIISDVMMPVMNGFEMIEKLKKDNRTSHIPVILLTAMTHHNEKIMGLESGAEDYIIKPFDYEELMMRVANILRNREIIKEKFKIDTSFISGEMTLEYPDDSFLKKLNQILEDNYQDEGFGTAALVEKMTVSRSQLHSKLKKLTAMSASEYLRSFRLRKAAVYLSQEKITVSEIAFKVGFSDTTYFIRCFRQQFGTTPGLYANPRH